MEPFLNDRSSYLRYKIGENCLTIEDLLNLLVTTSTIRYLNISNE